MRESVEDIKSSVLLHVGFEILAGHLRDRSSKCLGHTVREFTSGSGVRARVGHTLAWDVVEGLCASQMASQPRWCLTLGFGCMCVQEILNIGTWACL